MRPTGLKAGDKVIVLGNQQLIVNVTQDVTYPGYLLFTTNGSSQLVRVHYETNLSMWGTIPVLL